MKKLSLYSLTMVGFSIGMTEFMMMGVLPDVADTLRITIPEVGHLISAYALGVVIGAPLMVALAGNFPPKKVLMGLMVAFGLFNSLFAIAPGYEWLVVARLFSGLPHGAFLGGLPIAAGYSYTSPEYVGAALAFTGLVLCVILYVRLNKPAPLAFQTVK